MPSTLDLPIPRADLVRAWIPAVFAIGLAVFVVVSVWQARQLKLRADLMADFSFESRELALRLADRMSAWRQVLRGARSTLVALGAPTPEQWTDYVKTLYLPVDLPGGRGLGFVRAVKPGMLEEHEARARSRLNPDYRVWPVEDRSGAFAPITRLAPGDGGNAALIGRDLLREAALRGALDDSAAYARTLLSEPLGLPRDGDESASPHVFLLQPIYQPRKAVAGERDAGVARQAAVLGWVFALYHTGTLIGETVGKLPPTMRLRVLAGEQGPVLFDSAVQGMPDWRGAEPLRVRAPVEIGGQTWVLIFEGFPRAWSNQTPFGAELAAVGIICVLFALAAVLATRMRLTARRLAALGAALATSNARYQHLASHDALTGVANRTRFRERLKHRLDDGTRAQCPSAVIYIDLDRFKPVNDTLGHQAGDDLLVAVTGRIKAVLRAEDLLARRGGDEFVVLLDVVDTREEAERIAARICEVLARPFAISGHAVSISGSLGLAVFPEDGRDDEALIACADARMYRAKEGGRNRWVSRSELGSAAAGQPLPTDWVPAECRG